MGILLVGFQKAGATLLDKLLLILVINICYKYISKMEGYSSGQRGQTVNLLALPSQVRILPPPFDLSRVWYNGRTSAFQADDAGSIPATR